MKKSIFTTALFSLLLLCGGVARGQHSSYPPYDFTSVNEDDDTLYYRITSSEAPFTVAVTRCHDSIFHTLQIPFYAYQIGQPGFVYPVYDYDSLISIPSNVTHNGVNYTVTAIDNEAFYMQKAMRTVIIPPTVTIIDTAAFFGCSVMHVEMPNVTHIRHSAFYNSHLSSVDIPECITVIEKLAFVGNPFTTVSIPSSITVLENSVFAYCEELTQVNLPDHLDSIKEAAFYGTPSLKKITIPSEVTYIGYFAFEGGYDPTFGLGLDTLIMQGITPPEIDLNAFSLDHNLYVLVPCHTIEAYQTDQNWLLYSNYMAYHEDCTEVEISLKQTIKAYPIPFQNVLMVECDAATTTKIEIMDVLGQLQYVGVPSDDKLVINTSVFPSGVYILTITSNKKEKKQIKILKK